MINEKELENKAVIVTGGAGFIGSHLCEELYKYGSIVFCLDNFSSGRYQNIKHLDGMKNFHIVDKDICDLDPEMESLFSKSDFVFNNAASKKNICLTDPKRDLKVNSEGTLNLLELSMKHNIKKFVHASTGSVYGEPTIFPTNELHPLKPVSYYGVSKLGGERYVDVFNHLYKLNTTIIRYFHVYGPRQESNEFGGVVSIFLRQIVNNQNPTVFGDGEQVRSFTWVKDLVKVNVAAALNPIANGKVYNAASGINVSINELAEKMIDILGANNLKPEYHPPLIGDIMKFDVCNKNVSNDLGINFEKDFWKTLKYAIKDTEGFLNLNEE